jgi:sporulation protein YlmC with PRC-barrel domain
VTDVDIDTALDWRGRTVVDRDGEKIGTLKEIYLDERDRPSWGSVATGLFGRRETLVPLAELDAQDDILRVPFAGDHVKEAPNVEPDVQLSAEDEDRLYRHYELDTSTEAEPAPEAEAPPEDDAMTRSEEEVVVRKEERPRERVRLKKYVVTDYVKKTVPVQREKVELEYDDPPAEGPPRE